MLDDQGDYRRIVFVMEQANKAYIKADNGDDDSNRCRSWDIYKSS
jgi:hypothetical protein